MGLPPVLRSLILHLAPGWVTGSEQLQLTQQIQQVPGRQVGIWYCGMGNKNCWEAIGPIRESFQKLSTQIRRSLEECGPPDDAIVSWSVYMIGRSRDTAVPTILICSRDKKVRKTVRALIEENRILDQCKSLSFNIGDCSIAPDHYRMPPANDAVQMLSGDTYSATTGSACSEPAGAPVWCTSASIEAGMRVFVEVSPNSNEKRFATIGSIFSANGKYYATTVGHLFENGSRPQHEEDDVEFEFDIAGDDRSDSSSDFVVKIKQSVHTRVTDDQGLHKEVLADKQSEESQGSAYANPTEPAPEMNSKQYLPESNTPLVDSEPVESLIRLGRVVSVESNDTSSDLDYAVIEIDHGHNFCANHLKKNSTACIAMAQTICEAPKTAEVVAKTASGGHIKGQLSETPSFVRFPYAAGFREVWTVRFDKPLSKGDCGSMVIDSRTRQLYGHIVAGSPLSGVAYIVPAHEMFRHINQTLGLELELPVRNKWSVCGLKRLLGVGRLHLRLPVHLPVRDEDDSSNLKRPLGVRHVLSTQEIRARTDAIDYYSGEYSRQEVLDFLDSGGIPWRVLICAITGFFADSYNLFATNFMVPLLAVVFAFDNTSGNLGLMLNVASFCGVAIGQVLFGVLVDMHGRRKTYGFELFLVILGTLGMVTTSGTSIMLWSWLVFWRFIMGIGIGGDYPLSAIITAEFAPQRYRAKMMTAVSLSQPLGQLFAGLVSAFVARQTLKLGHLDFDLPYSNRRTSCDDRCMVDYVWRIVVAIGLVPTLITLLLRLNIPESPRYLIDVMDNPRQATATTAKSYHDPTAKLVTRSMPWTWRASESRSKEKSQPLEGNQATPEAFLSGFRHFMWDQRNWRYLAGPSICWMLFDFAFYGLGMSQPMHLTEKWNFDGNRTSGLTDWLQVHSNNIELPTVSEALHHQASMDLLIPTIGVLAGFCVVFFSVDHLERRMLQGIGFIGLFEILGFPFSHSFKYSHSLIRFLSHVFFSMGPNSTTFMLPAELFPTRYRGTGYGLAAAIGKTGSLIGLSILGWIRYSTTSPSTFLRSKTDVALLLVSALMLVAAFITWRWIPEPRWNDQPDAVSANEESNAKSQEQEHKRLFW